MKKLYIFLLSSIFLVEIGYSQQVMRGKVSDDTGGGLPGAAVLIKETTNGTITDSEGNYSIEANSGDVLVFSFVGYQTVERTVGSETSVNVTLSEDSKVLSEVVVTALGLTEKRDEIASTYSKIDAEKLLQRSENKLIDGIGGKAAGVYITGTSSDPGAGSNIQIRGVSSLGGTSQPLIVVDGVPISSNNIEGDGSPSSAGVSQQSRLNDLNPDDIESFQIFKGASAGALYGNRASNGVIVITTKRGKKGRIRVTYSSGIAIDEISLKHSLQNKYGQGQNGAHRATSAFSWGDKISDRSGESDVVDTSGEFFESLVSDNIIYPITAKNSKETFVDKNFDKVFQTGITYDNKITITGGGDKGTFYLSGSHVKQDGIIKSSTYQKSNFTVSSRYHFTDKLTSSVKLNYIHTGSNRTQQGSNVAGLYLGLLRTSPDFDITDYKGNYHSKSGTITSLRQRSYRRYLGNSDNAIYNNPLWVVENQRSTAEVDRLVSSAELQYAWNRHINTILRGGVDFYTDARLYFFPYYTAGSARRYGLLRDETIFRREFNMDFLTSFRYTITKSLNTNVVLGFGLNDRYRKTDFAEADNFVSNFQGPFNPSQISAKANTSFRTTKLIRRNIRFYGTANFDYADQLFVAIGGAYEKHSSLPKDNNGFFYPSVELGWLFTKLLQDSGPLSFGKLRLTFGQVGNVPLPHRENTLFEVGSFSSFSDEITLADFGGDYQLDERLGNSALRPERKTEYEVGLDLRFLEDKLSFSTTYYRNEITDVILDFAIAPSLGFSEIYGNGATIQNEGWEVELRYDILDNEKWKLFIAPNFSTNKNLVSKLQGGGVIDYTAGSSIKSVAIEGQPLGVLYTQGALRNADNSLDLDSNGFPQVDKGGDKLVGDPNPDWRGGVQLGGSYKGFSLSAVFDTSQGNDLAQRTRFILSYFGTHSDVSNSITLEKDIVNYAGDTFKAGETVRGNIGNFGGEDVLLDETYYRRLYGFGDGKLNEFAVHDGSWTRLREIALSYTLNSEGFRKATKLRSIEFTASGRNLAIWTNVAGIDPDVNQYGVGRGKGIDYFTNPGSRTYAFTIKFNY